MRSTPRPRASSILTIACFLLLIRTSVAESDLIVHEWGTFTVLQDETGKELAGINTDDEPVPKFVHDVAPLLLAKPILSDLHWAYRQKGAPRHHPLVTMRLETPVIYFYPQKSARPPQNVDVEVTFRGGWLTQFYPQAEFSASDVRPGSFDFRRLTPHTEGKLTWKNVEIGASTPGPDTNDPVWLRPRKVQAASVAISNGEAEKYLFYRGVGQLKAPLRVVLDRTTKQLTVRANFKDVLSEYAKLEMASLWLVNVDQQGTCRYRRLPGIQVNTDEQIVRLRANYTFEAATASDDRKAELDEEMHSALVKDGLYSDEATALLSTWQRSYFATPGLRLFYLVPRIWTDHYLPLAVSGSPAVTRSMVGRIELVADEQRALLTKLAATKPAGSEWVENIPASAARERFFAGRSDFGDLGVKIPEDYRLYLALGRFRNALVTAEEARTRSQNLQQFIDLYALHPFRVHAGDNNDD